MADATPTYQETVTSNIPEWARGYATDLLGFGSALTYPKQKIDPNTGQPVFQKDPKTGKDVPVLESGFTPYKGELVAGLSPMQTEAMKSLSQMSVSPQTSQATGFAGLAALRAQELGKYDPLKGENAYTSPEAGKIATDYLKMSAPTVSQYQMQGPERVSAGTLTQYQMGPAERIGAERFGAQQMQDYMSPYMQGVVERQKQGAVQDYMKQLPGMGAAAARAGARGGTRASLLQAEAQRGLAQRMGDIEAQGLQSAYQQASSQFGQDRAAQMQAAMANQQAGLTTGQQNLGALLGIQQLGAGQSMQAQLANQQAAQQAGQANLQANINQAQFGAGQSMQAQQSNQQAGLQSQQQALAQQQALNQFAQQNAAMRAQYGLAGQQLGEQSRQFGAGLGLQGLQQQLAAAGQLGQLGQQQYQQQAGILGAQLGAGAQQQALKQRMLESNYQRFIDEQSYPYKQLEFMSNLLRGTPSTAETRNIYSQAPSTLAQISGLSGGLGGLFGSFGS